MATDIQLRRDTAANWTSNNTVLKSGEPGVETDTGRLKIGDGSTTWSNLDYVDQDIAALNGWDSGELPSQFDSPTLVFKDPLRASVEAASGGRATVMYDDQDYPSYMVRIPAFNLEDIHADFGSGRHPAFIVDDTEIAEIWIGMHQAYVYGSRALSLPGLDPTVSVDYDEAQTYSRNKGSGWHLMTNAEWAAVALWVLKQEDAGNLAHVPRGNTDYGRAHDAYAEVGTGRNNEDPGSGDRVLTGSGPVAWRHDLSSAGISDLVGNIWEWVGGLRLDDGEINVIPDNDAALDAADHSSGSTQWRAIAASDGSLVSPGTAGTCKYDTTPSDLEIDDEIDNRDGDVGDDSNGDSTATDLDEITAAGGITVPARLKRLLLAPGPLAASGDRVYVRNYGERLPRRGGYWANAAGAGLGALNLSSPRSVSHSSIGFRPAFVAQP
ncbi:MAG: SUMF1/EgtB/PvdO family nonheme iron enzyme [Spirochaetaceae bacterium]